MTTRLIRLATPADRAAIDAIYAHYVRHSTCTYAEVVESDDERRAWFEAHGPRHPITVLEDSGTVLGWASLSPWKSRSAYRWSVELSIYLHPDVLHRGLGRELMADLIARAEALGYRALIGGVSADQAASLRLHERFGFEKVAHLREVGFKFGRWLDVVYLERLLRGPADAESAAGGAR